MYRLKRSYCSGSPLDISLSNIPVVYYASISQLWGMRLVATARQVHSQKYLTGEADFTVVMLYQE